MAKGTIDARGGDHANGFMQLKTADVQLRLQEWPKSKVSQGNFVSLEFIITTHTKLLS